MTKLQRYQNMSNAQRVRIAEYILLSTCFYKEQLALYLDVTTEDIMDWVHGRGFIDPETLMMLHDYCTASFGDQD